MSAISIKKVGRGWKLFIKSIAGTSAIAPLSTHGVIPVQPWVTDDYEVAVKEAARLQEAIDNEPKKKGKRK